jgi:hypothetical protein
MIRNRRARTRHNETAKFAIDPKRLNGSKIHFTFDDVVTESGCVPRGAERLARLLKEQLDNSKEKS